MTEILPAILPESERDLLQKVAELPVEANFIHLDVLEEDVWAPIDRDFEAHLMVKEPEKIIDKWVERGAKRLIMHSLPPDKGGLRGVELGLGVELEAPLEEIFPLLPRVDFVHFMSIREIGGQGRPFEPEIFDRIKEVKKRFPNLPVSVDGGVSAENWRELESAGADRLAVGSGFKELWNSLTKE